jgi:AbrB family looped-hinge helix DNA binding protein
MPSSTLTSKGQITIPQAIREYLRLETGQQVEFHISEAGKVILFPKNRDLRSLKGIVKSRRRRPLTLREMDRAIAKGASGK